MKPNLAISFLYGVLILNGLSAEESSSLQVQPSAEVHFPDASAVLNPQSARKPLLGSPPVQAVQTPPSASTKLVERGNALSPGWYLRWTLKGTQEEAQSQAAGFALPTGVQSIYLQPGAGNQWFLVAGPLDPKAMAAAVKMSGGDETYALIRK